MPYPAGCSSAGISTSVGAMLTDRKLKSQVRKLFFKICHKLLTNLVLLLCMYICGGRTISNTTTDGQNTAAFSSSPIPSLPPSHSHTFPPSYRLTLTNSLPSVFSPSNIPSLTPSHFIILKELQSLFPCAVPSDGTNIDETTSKLYECTPEVCREERGEGEGRKGSWQERKAEKGGGEKL